MVIKSYRDVSPTSYQGVPEGVQIREMITADDGAPTFAMRVFDVQKGAATPYHTHTWEHEVYIISGTGRCERKGKRRHSNLVIQSTLRQTSSIASWPTLSRRYR